jgi:polysaccharide export outer membrane protein
MMVDVMSKLAEFTRRFLVLMLCACGFAGSAAAQSQPGPAAPASVPADYVIGPGDVLQVFVWRNPELSVSVPVRPDGRISTPLCEDMVAVGKTPSGLARDIEKVLADVIRSPQVNVIVTTPVGSLSQVKAIGQVKTPQGIAYREGMRVLDLLLLVGGMTDFAAGNRAKIVRTEHGVSRDLPVKLAKLVDKGDMSQNIELKPGDVLIVPESRL